MIQIVGIQYLITCGMHGWQIEYPRLKARRNYLQLMKITVWTNWMKIISRPTKSSSGQDKQKMKPDDKFGGSLAGTAEKHTIQTA